MRMPGIMRREVSVEVKKPIRGRLHVFFVWLMCIRLCKINCMLGFRKLGEYTVLIIPKIKVVDGS